MWMLEPRRQLNLPPEAIRTYDPRRFRRQHLHDDASAERAFLRDEHACHAAAPKLAGHGVRRAKGRLELLPKLPLPARVRGTHLLTVPPSDAVVC